MKNDSIAASDGSSVDAIGNNMNKVVVSDRLNFGTLPHQLLEYSKADRISDMIKVFKANEIKDMVKMSYRWTVASDMLSSLSQNDDDDDSFECSLCSWGQTKRLCTSCEQKLGKKKKSVNQNSSNLGLIGSPSALKLTLKLNCMILNYSNSHRRH